MAHQARQTGVASVLASAEGQYNWLRTLFKLGKGKLSGLVAASAAAGYALGSPEAIDMRGLASTTAGTYACALSANALNQAREAVQDGLMRRTAKRPIPAGRMSSFGASAFALVVGAAGGAHLGWEAGPEAAALGLGNIALYAGPYTSLKQITIANTWVGAIVGAIPPLMGYAGARHRERQAGDGGSGEGLVSARALWLPSILYLWQMPHFMALAHLGKGDYTRAGYRMLAQVDPTGRRVAGVALRNAIALIPMGFIAERVHLTSSAFSWECAGISGLVAALTTAFFRSPSPAGAKRVFKAGLLQLPALMGLACFHRVPHERRADCGHPEWSGLSRLGRVPDEELSVRGDGERFSSPALAHGTRTGCALPCHPLSLVFGLPPSPVQR